MLTKDLRVATVTKLYMNLRFCSEHLFFTSLCYNHGNNNWLGNVLRVSVSQKLLYCNKLTTVIL